MAEGENPGTVAEEDHRIWYREMFAPSVAAGLARPADLAGYRNTPVYIQRSMHVPPSPSAVHDAMPAFFDLLRDEPEPSVRVVLGHFLFVHVHPCPDGNGRIGRFLMNVMLAAAGWPWAIIPVERRDEYMAALEAASGDRWRGRLAIPLRGIAGAPASAVDGRGTVLFHTSVRREIGRSPTSSADWWTGGREAGLWSGRLNDTAGRASGFIRIRASNSFERETIEYRLCECVNTMIIVSSEFWYPVSAMRQPMTVLEGAFQIRNYI